MSATGRTAELRRLPPLQCPQVPNPKTRATLSSTIGAEVLHSLLWLVKQREPWINVGSFQDSCGVCNKVSKESAVISESAFPAMTAWCSLGVNIVRSHRTCYVQRADWQRNGALCSHRQRFFCSIPDGYFKSHETFASDNCAHLPEVRTVHPIIEC